MSHFYLIVVTGYTSREFIEAREGNAEYVDNPDKLINAEFVIPLVSYEDGIVHKIHAGNIGVIAVFWRIAS